MLTLLQGLSQDGRSWIAAEATLAQAEVASDARRVAGVLALLVLVFASLFAAVMLFTVFMLALLAPLVGGLGNAAGLLSLGFFVIAALASWSIRQQSTKQFGLMLVLMRWWSIAVAGSGGTYGNK